MTSDGPDVEISVVICAHDRERQEDLVAAVDSIRAQRVAAAEILVVVDHNPRLLDAARLRLPGAMVIENRNAAGVSGARNTGAAAARGGVIAFLDDDAIAAEDWIERLREGYRDPRVIAVGGTVEPLWSGSRPRWLPPEFDWVIGCTYLGLPESSAPVRNLIGCNMSFRRAVLEVAGGFRLDLGRAGNDGYGCEETELCIRIARSRPCERILFEPEARVRHRVDARRLRWSYFRSRCIAEGRSKARLSRIAGVSRATAAERSYVLRTLTAGVVRETGAALRGDLFGLGRAGLMLAGFSLTLFGYVTGRSRRRHSRSQG